MPWAKCQKIKLNTATAAVLALIPAAQRHGLRPGSADVSFQSEELKVKENSPQILRRFVELAGGEVADIVIIPTASIVRNLKHLRPSHLRYFARDRRSPPVRRPAGTQPIVQLCRQCRRRCLNGPARVLRLQSQHFLFRRGLHASNPLRPAQDPRRRNRLRASVWCTARCWRRQTCWGSRAFEAASSDHISDLRSHVPFCERRHVAVAGRNAGQGPWTKAQ